MKNFKIRLLAIVTAIAMVVTMMPVVAMAADGETGGAADIQLHNPVTDSEGVASWDCIYFGTYYDKDTNDKASVKWRVLNITDADDDGVAEDALLVADRNLDFQQFNNRSNNSWGGSTLRAWLNGTGKYDDETMNFIDQLVPKDFQTAIKNTKTGESDTDLDKIFLLSKDDMINPAYGFVPNDSATKTRESKNTGYVASFDEADPEGQTDPYWLRDGGDSSDKCYVVDGDGALVGYRAVVTFDYCVRPAMHLDLVQAEGNWHYAGFVKSDGTEKYEAGAYICKDGGEKMSDQAKFEGKAAWDGDSANHRFVCKEHNNSQVMYITKSCVEGYEEVAVAHEVPNFKSEYDAWWMEECDVPGCSEYRQNATEGKHICFKGDSAKASHHFVEAADCEWAACTEEGKDCHALVCKTCKADGVTSPVYVFDSATGYYKEGHHLATEPTEGCPLCEKPMSKATVTVTAAVAYNGKAQTPAVTVKYNGVALKKGTDFTVAYSNNKNVGKATVKVTGAGVYKGTVTKTFKINPKGTTIKAPAKLKKGFQAKWAKQSAKMAATRINGYQVRYSLKSSMASAKTKTVVGYAKTSVKVTKLKAKKKYFVQVRTYKTVNGVKYYSAWSAKKAVTTK